MKMIVKLNWELIDKYNKEGRLNEVLKSGDKIKFKLKNGYPITLHVGRDEEGKTYFIFRPAPKDFCAMDEGKKASGWKTSDLRAYANGELLEEFPDEVKALIKPDKDGNKLFCLSFTQVFGKADDVKDDGSRIDLFKVGFNPFPDHCWWLRTPRRRKDNLVYFYTVTPSGIPLESERRYKNGLVFAFCIEETEVTSAPKEEKKEKEIKNTKENLQTPEKTIVIINGKGGCGKDALIKALGKEEEKVGRRVWNYSSIDTVKKVAKTIGWDGKKDEKGRRYLAELKAVITRNSDVLTKETISVCNNFLKSKDRFLFIHIREPEEIRKIRLLMSPKIDVKTLLVKSNWANGTYGNASDDEVDNFAYDAVFTNKDGLEQSAALFKVLMYNFPKKEKKEKETKINAQIGISATLPEGDFEVLKEMMEKKDPSVAEYLKWLFARKGCMNGPSRVQAEGNGLNEDYEFF